MEQIRSNVLKLVDRLEKVDDEVQILDKHVRLLLRLRRWIVAGVIAIMLGIVGLLGVSIFNAFTLKSVLPTVEVQPASK